MHGDPPLGRQAFSGSGFRVGPGANSRGRFSFFTSGVTAGMVSGPTFSLHGAGTKPYRGRYAPFRDRWTVFTDSDPRQVPHPAVA